MLDHPLENKVWAAEAKFLFKMAECDYSFRSADQTPELFTSMFSDSEIAKRFQLGRSKASYCVSDGLSPMLFGHLCGKLRASDGCFTLLYDETTTKQRIKQMDVLARFWDEGEGVKTQYMTSLFFARATAEDLEEKFVKKLFTPETPLPWDKMFNTSTDGPRINEKLHGLMNTELKSTGHPGILPFLPCSLHVAHNAFHKMLTDLPYDIPQLCFDLHAWFKHSPCKIEDYKKMADDTELDDNRVINIFSRSHNNIWACRKSIATKLFPTASEKLHEPAVWECSRGEKSVRQQEYSDRREMPDFKWSTRRPEEDEGGGERCRWGSPCMHNEQRDSD